MFRPMRRGKQALSDQESRKILSDASSGVLAVLGDDGYPYAVPLSFVFDGKDRLYFHCAVSGHKLDAIQNEPKVSFCVIAQDDVHPSEFTSYYKSVIAFGKARILDADEEICPALRLLGEKYMPDDPQGTEKEIDRFLQNVRIIEMQIDHLTGKQAKELISNG